MYIFKRIRLRAIAGLAATCAVLLTTIAITSSTAMAMRVPPEGGDGVIQPPPVPVAGGMPGWQITLIAVGAALVAAVLAVLADRARAARRRSAVAAGSMSAQVSGMR